MKIKAVRASVHVFNTALPLIGGRDAPSDLVVCEIETDEGHVGIGLASRFMCHSIATAVIRHLGPAVIGLDPRNLEQVHGRLHKLVSERGQTIGVNLCALSCIDLALWDIIGKAANRTVAELLGGHRDHADIYVTFGFGQYDRDQLVEMARSLIAQGHSRLKMLVGVAKGGIEEDAGRVRHVRDALGPGVLLAIDANESLSLDHAMRLAGMIEECNIAWFEDPVWRNHPRDLALLRRRTTIPLSAGQMDGHSARFREFIEHNAIDIFMPNSLYNGGMTETRRVAYLAQIYDRPLSDAGGGGIFCLHHVAGFRNGTLAEMHLAVEELERQLFLDAPVAKGGRTLIPKKPGFGVTLNRDALKDTLVQ